jgi:hypothetical protein
MYYVHIGIYLRSIQFIAWKMGLYKYVGLDSQFDSQDEAVVKKIIRYLLQ